MWDLLKRVGTEAGRSNLSLLAAGVAFYALLAITPGATALVTLYGLLFDVADVQAQVTALDGLLPVEARDLVARQLASIVTTDSSRLGIGFIVALAVALWSANSGTSALMSALDVAYGETEKRGIVAYYGQALLMTFGAILFGVAALALIAVLPAAIALLPLGDYGRLLSWLRWPALLCLWPAGLAVLYRYAPSHSEPRFAWISRGALAATLLWLAGSALFSLYVSHVASYDRTYGSLGAVVILLLWLWLTCFTVLLGAALNGALRHPGRRT
jgi:membrane protein